MASQWYYLVNGQQQGPIGSDQLKQMAASGQLQPTDMIWREGLADWVQAGRIKGLFGEGAVGGGSGAGGAPAPVVGQPANAGGSPSQAGFQQPQVGATQQYGGPTQQYGGGHSVGGSGDFEFARSKVRGPAMSLIIVSALTLLLSVIGGLMNLVGASAQPSSMYGSSYGAGQQVGQVVGTIISLAFNGTILFGAIQMMGLKSRALAMTACIMALVPCIGPCIILGIPFGIWGLVALSDQRVKTAFA